MRLVCVASFGIPSLLLAAAGDSGSFSRLVLRRLAGTVGTANLPDLSVAEGGPRVGVRIEEEVPVRLCGEWVFMRDCDVDIEALCPNSLKSGVGVEFSRSLRMDIDEGPLL